MSKLSLKWGTLKAWSFSTPEELKLLEEYGNSGYTPSAMLQRDTPRQKGIICELIDLVDDPRGIYLDWDGEYVTKEVAKDYVRNYHK